MILGSIVVALFNLVSFLFIKKREDRMLCVGSKSYVYLITKGPIQVEAILKAPVLYEETLLKQVVFSSGKSFASWTLVSAFYSFMYVFLYMQLNLSLTNNDIQSY